MNKSYRYRFRAKFTVFVGPEGRGLSEHTIVVPSDGLTLSCLPKTLLNLCTKGDLGSKNRQEWSLTVSSRSFENL